MNSADGSDSSTSTNHLRALSKRQLLPQSHIDYLRSLKAAGFEPRVLYDIGACVLHWSTEAHKIWPDATIVAFDAFDKAEFLYKEAGMPYHIGVLSKNTGDVVEWYENATHPGGNSYYREVGCTAGDFFPLGTSMPRVTWALDDLVAEQDFPLPDLVKIDVQGAERDVIEGGLHTIGHAQHMVCEMQHMRYNDGAPMVGETLPWIESLGWKCVVHRLHDNGPDADYAFVRA